MIIGRQYAVMVHMMIDMITDEHLPYVQTTIETLTISKNPQGSELVGVRPLSGVSLTIECETGNGCKGEVET
jgi:hypothetical protein